MRLRAVKSLTYATRRLVPGDVFETVRDRDARALLATRKVERVRAEADIPPPPPAVRAKIEAAFEPPQPAVSGESDGHADGTIPAAGVGVSVADDLAAARAAYREAFGWPAYHAWDAETVRSKIAGKDE